MDYLFNSEENTSKNSVKLPVKPPPNEEGLIPKNGGWCKLFKSFHHPVRFYRVNLMVVKKDDQGDYFWLFQTLKSFK